ncbi:MAG: Ig-like domain-containing protein, partial [Kofleriaceae bacterium]
MGSEHESSSSDDDHLGASPGAPTLHDGEGSTTQAIGGIQPITLACQITISGPSSGLVGVPVHYTASSSCSPGTPEVQWYHRVGTASFVVIQAYSATTYVDYTATAVGSHQFFARVRAQGTTRTSTSNTLTAALGNVAPVALNDVLVVDEDTAGAVDVLANDSDPNHDALTATLASAPASGTATIAAGVITYTPQANFHGSDAVTYLANDGHGNTATGTLTITVNAVNDPPVALGDALAVVEDGSGTVDVALNDADLDGDALAIASITAPAHGTASFSGTTISYAPAANYNGVDALQYTISDGAGGTATATLAITISAVNDAPVAVANTAFVTEDYPATIDVVANDSDPDDDALAITSVTQGAHGTVTISDAHHVSYAPALNYNGGDTFSYTISDGNGGTATASVAITVTSVDDPPAAVADAATVAEDSSVTIDVAANDSDVDG